MDPHNSGYPRFGGRSWLAAGVGAYVFGLLGVFLAGTVWCAEEESSPSEPAALEPAAEAKEPTAAIPLTQPHLWCGRWWLEEPHPSPPHFAAVVRQALATRAAERSRRGL